MSERNSEIHSSDISTQDFVRDSKVAENKRSRTQTEFIKMDPTDVFCIGTQQIYTPVVCDNCYELTHSKKW